MPQTDPRFMPPTPFARLVRVHAVSVIGDACLAGSLAGSLFFQGTTSGARDKVLLYLILTLAPFAVVTPILGPALDRIAGGRRLTVVASCVGHALLCLVMSRYITQPSPEGLLIYPLAFGTLVLSKGYSIARSSLVPTVVPDPDDLVRANSRLALISGIFTLVGVAPALLLQWIFDADWSLVLAAIVFVAATVLAAKLPRTEGVVPDRKTRELEREELHQPSILLAGSAMGVIRGAVGFLGFFAAFAFRDDKPLLGLVGMFAVAGAFAGNLLAPSLRQLAREEVMVAGALLTAAGAAVLGGLAGGTFGVGIAALFIAVGSASGKLGFDSLLQRDGPDAVRGRAFAMFEARFQLFWCIGALLGLIPVGEKLGLLVLGSVLAFGGISYVAGLRAARGRVSRTKLRPDAVDRAFDKARENVKERMRQRKGSGRGGARGSGRTTRGRANGTDGAPEIRRGGGRSAGRNAGRSSGRNSGRSSGRNAGRSGLPSARPRPELGRPEAPHPAPARPEPPDVFPGGS